MMEKLGKMTRISFNMVQLVWPCLWMVSLHSSHRNQAFGSVMGLFWTCLFKRGFFFQSLFLIENCRKLSFLSLLKKNFNCLWTDFRGKTSYCWEWLTMNPRTATHFFVLLLMSSRYLDREDCAWVQKKATMSKSNSSWSPLICLQRKR